MYTCTVYLLAFLVRYSGTSSPDAVIFKKEYLNPQSVDHGKMSGRWYEHMDTLDSTLRENTFLDTEVICDETRSLAHFAHRWISSLEECRTTALSVKFNTSDSPEGEFIRMSTKDPLGKMTIRYFDPHPTEGFAVLHRQIHLGESFLIACRQRDPCNLNQTIEQVVVALQLDIRDFYVKSKDFGNTI